MSISYGTFRGLESVTIENEATRAMFLKYGGRMVSLVNLKTGREYLTVGEGDVHRVSNYGDNFNMSSDLSGIDEIFPACEPGPYPFYPWQGTEIPPHGELWMTDWDLEAQGEELVMSVHGVRFPYTFPRRTRLLPSGVLRADYTITNHSPYDMHFIWLLHPLFCMDDDVVISLPDGTTQFLSLFSTMPALGKWRTFSWPKAEAGGRVRDMTRSADMDPGGCDKFYGVGPFTDGRMSLTYQPSGEGLELTFPAEKVPYAGIWINNGGLKGVRHVALEPATGNRDWLDKAAAAGESSILPGNGEYTFYLEYRLY